MGAVASTNIVTDGLVYCIDAANKRCYSGTGTTGVDLVKGGTTTLTNQVTFGSNNMGVFAFDGTDDYIEQDWSFTLGTGDLTMEFWVKMEGWIIHSQGANVFLSVTDPNVHEELQFGIENSTAQRLAVYLHGGSNGTKTGDEVYSWNLNQWYHLVATRISSTVALYRDGVSLTVATGATNTGNVAAISAFLLGNQYKSTEYKHDFQGDMGPIRIYNKGLTADEVSQNYEATKPRFVPRITKSNLELNLDAGDPASYVGGTTWKDTANGYNATLVNTIYSSEGGGSMDLDGTDDSVTISSNAAGDFSMKGWSILTYEFWIKRTDTTGWGRLLYESTQTSGGFLVGPAFSGSNYYAYIDTDDGSSMGYVGGWGSTTDWIHLVTTYDGSNVVTYRNGVQVGTQSLTGDIKNTSGSYGGVVFGRTNHGGSDWFDGRVATIRVYQAALSAAEIMDNYQKTKARFGH